MRKLLTSIAVTSVILAPGAALAGHGKAGLWNTSTTTNIAMAMPPEVAAMMKARGMTMKGQTYNAQMCMTQAEVDADRPPHMGNENKCTSKVVSQSASAMAVDTVCNGEAKGTGHVQIRYSGAEHYTGSYSFKGEVDGNPSNMSSSFQGDWVKADCGLVKPFDAKAMAH
jgi:hypothetical protein